ncbi:hypothetical protein F444_11045, partial [Phytophthora nicotianae P1976]
STRILRWGSRRIFSLTSRTTVKDMLWRSCCKLATTRLARCISFWSSGVGYVSLRTHGSPCRTCWK